MCDGLALVEKETLSNINIAAAFSMGARDLGGRASAALERMQRECAELSRLAALGTPVDPTAALVALGAAEILVIWLRQDVESVAAHLGALGLRVDPETTKGRDS